MLVELSRQLIIHCTEGFDFLLSPEESALLTFVHVSKEFLALSPKAIAAWDIGSLPLLLCLCYDVISARKFAFWIFMMGRVTTFTIKLHKS